MSCRLLAPNPGSSSVRSAHTRWNSGADVAQHLIGNRQEYLSLTGSFDIAFLILAVGGCLSCHHSDSVCCHSDQKKRLPKFSIFGISHFKSVDYRLLGKSACRSHLRANRVWF